jgi:ADP-heptose:LPS heptosyltransferase
MRILVVRRDNIGDLVCTTPLFSALRQRFAQGWIGALVNSYNAAVLDRNPDLDAVMAYTKLKHLAGGQGALAALGGRLAMLWRLRRMRLDAVVLATPDFVPRVARLARWLAPRQVVGFSDGSRAAARLLDVSIPVSRLQGLHEVERVFSLAAHFGIAGAAPALRLAADPDEVRKAAGKFGGERRLKVAVHITARRPRQRWPAERFAELIARLHAEHAAQAMLLWFPGPADDPRHPGDDDKAREIGRRLAGRTPLIAYRAGPLPELIGALAACDVVITPDGGALHLAAGLGKPVVALFGDAAPERWRPWGVPQRVLQPRSRDLADLSVAEVANAFAELTREGIHV